MSRHFDGFRVRSPGTCCHSRGVARLLAAIAVAMLVAVSTASADSPDAPVVTSSPDLALVAAAGDVVQLSAAAVGTPAPTVQWQVAASRSGPWSDIPGATSTTLSVPSTTDPTSAFAVGNAFRALFTNPAGSAASRPTKLVRRTNWMSDLRSEIGAIPLTELTIPGAHDMGTYGINGGSSTSSDGQASDIGCLVDHGVCERYGQAQQSFKDTFEELQDGIRYFDLRVCRTDSGVFVTCHGLEAAPLSDILDGTRAWVDSHPGEVVILDLNHHYLPTDGSPAKADAEAAQVEQAFSLPGGGSLLIPPQYCTPGDPTTGTCAAGLTLDRIHDEHLGSVIVNFENDDAPGDDCVVSLGGQCIVFRQPVSGTGFYDAHPLLGAQSGAARLLRHAGMCTPGTAFPSCFGADPSVGVVAGNVLNRLGARGEVSSANQFFVQFLQTTPDLAFVLANLDKGLLDMAEQSNRFIGPRVRPRALDAREPERARDQLLRHHRLGPVHFDFVEEILREEEDARTPPVIHIGSLSSPRRADGSTPPCSHRTQTSSRSTSARATIATPPGSTPSRAPTASTRARSIRRHLEAAGRRPRQRPVHGRRALVRLLGRRRCAGRHQRARQHRSRLRLDADAGRLQDRHHAARDPLLRRGVRAQPARERAGNRHRRDLRARRGNGVGARRDDRIGRFQVALSASDVAGNTATAACPYTVGYRIGLDYDPSKAANSGSTVTFASSSSTSSTPPSTTRPSRSPRAR